jgi:hypothetical protein
MARRILIIVTRMHATQGGPDDEFVVMWKQDSNSPHAIIGVHRDTYRIIVLVHGYLGRFRGPNDVPGAVQEAINSLAITDSDEIGILYHPPAGWTLGRDHFSSLGGNIQFVKKYGAQSPAVYARVDNLSRSLEPQCFDSTWFHFVDIYYLMYQVLIPMAAEVMRKPNRSIINYVTNNTNIQLAWSRFCELTKFSPPQDLWQDSLGQAFSRLRDAMLQAIRRAGG